MTELFLKIVNMSISAGWLVLVVLVLRMVLNKAPKWVNVLLWGIVAVRLICPVAIESSVSLMNVDTAQEIADDILYTYVGPGGAYWDDSEEYQEAVDAGIEPIHGGHGHYYVLTGETPTTEIAILADRLAWVWFAGMSAMVIYTAGSYFSLRRKLRTAVILRNGIFQCEAVRSPFVLGIIKPKIYLPYHINAQDLEYVVAHESAHIRRRDHWWKPLGFFLLALHWFNPLLWAAYILLCRDIELACDEKVIREMGNEQRADYTQALVTCSVSRSVVAACPLAFGEVGVKERVKAVMNYGKPTFWVIVVSVISCAVVAVCFLTDPVNAIEGEYRIEGYGIYNNGSEYYILVNDGVELKCTKEQYEQVAALVERFRTGELEDTPIHVTYKQFLISHKRGTVLELKIPENESFGKTYVYEKEGIMGSFTITLYNDGTFFYYEGMASSYLASGTWKRTGDTITLTDDGPGGYGLVNHFRCDGNDLVFVEQDSANFVYVKVKDGERFFGTGEAFKHNGGATSENGSSESSYHGEGNLHLGLNAEVVEIDPIHYILYVKDIDEEDAVFGDRAAIDCSYATGRFNLLYVDYSSGDVRTIEFSDFEVGDAVIIGMYSSEMEKAFNGSAVAEQVQLSTQRFSSGTAREPNVTGNISANHPAAS